MAPTEQLTDLVKRQLGCPSGTYYSNGNCWERNGWYWWGRWVFAGIIIIFTIIVLILLARNSRRRRRQGVAPLRGTGWMAPPAYYPPPPQYSAQPPVYPQGTGQKFNQNDGYYANGQQEGIQLQQPQNTYQPPQNVYTPPAASPYGGEPAYSPPAGPPPGHRS